MNKLCVISQKKIENMKLASFLVSFFERRVKVLIHLVDFLLKQIIQVSSLVLLGSIFAARNPSWTFSRACPDSDSII